MLPELPLSSYRDAFLKALEAGRLLLEAEPGAGKSTLAPLWALESIPESQAVWLVQPRVLAAQALARRLAHFLGEQPGETVGYQVPYDNCSGTGTRLLLMTPGILLQHLLRDPLLDGVAVVMLDEIHERAVNQDLAWALLQEVQILRDDLQLVLMSATPDPGLQRQITQRLFAPGRCFPVSTAYLPPRKNAYGQTEKLDEHVLRALQEAADWQQQTTLVFLPGWRDIEACAQLVQQRYPAQKIMRLHSRITPQEQLKALDPDQGARLILATNIAETSLTIADVTLVIDSGLVRRAEFEQRTGITRLRDARISQASADQRRGRAGRVQAGHCIRLWSQDQPLVPADLPEIRTTDYLPLALRLAHWGSNADQLHWLESPGHLGMHQAQQQLQMWQLLDAAGRITSAGEQVAELGTHPRVAVLLQSAVADGILPEAVMLLALALHFELSPTADVSTWLAEAAQALQRQSHWRLQKKRWLGVLGTRLSPTELPLQKLAVAFNDRIGFRQDSGRYRLNSGISIAPLHPMDSPWAVFPIIQPLAKGHAGVGLQLVLNPEQQRQLSQQESQLVFKQNQWQRQLQWKMGGVMVAEETQRIPDADIADALLQHVQAIIAEKGLNAFPWPAAAERLLQSARLIERYALLTLPPLDDASLINQLHNWLQPFLTAQTKLENLPWRAGLEFYLGYDNCQKIQEILPESIQLPSGRHVNLTYAADATPEISAKLQEFFGCREMRLAEGRIPLRIHLLSPNGSPLAITTDLASFWQQAYPEVKKEMRGRYPRHPWPDNPLEHVATALTKKRLQNSPPA